jgi:hypothetical protein
VAELSALRDADQSARASAPRKRAKGHRGIVIEAMQIARRNKDSLHDFLDAAENGSVSGLEIRQPGPRDGGKYLITCDELSTESKFSKSTIEGWWTAAEPEKS